MRFLSFISKEVAYVRALTTDQKRLLLSTFLFSLAQPMIAVFSNTYLWRQSGDAMVLATFNVGHYVGLSLGFLLNGFLLKRFRSPQLLFLGCVLQGVIPVVLVYLGVHASAFACLLGLTLGIAAGLYWGNRNLLTSEHTAGEQRIKYISLEMALSIAAAVIAPAATGWFLVFGDRAHVYTTQQGYQIAAAIGFAFLTISGWNALHVKHAYQKIDKLFLKEISPAWNRMRLLDYVNGLVDGFERVIPLVIVLLFLGQEDSVGLVQSSIAVLSMVGMYLSGKRVKHKDHTLIVSLWSGVSFMGKITFAMLYSALGAILYTGFSGLVQSFRWSSLAAVMYEAIDREPGEGVAKRYRYLMDREFCLNAGRVSGLFLFMLAYVVFDDRVIRYGLMAAVVPQIIMILLVHVVTKRVPHLSQAS